MLRIALAQIATVGAFVSYHLGNAYMTEGHGMHPMLAGAFILMFVGIPYVTRWATKSNL